MVRALTSWVWLVDFDRKARALDATNELSADVSATLEQHFSAVHVLRKDEAALSLLRKSRDLAGFRESLKMSMGRLDSAPFEAASFDCVMLHDSIVTTGADARKTLAGARRLLRDGGWLQMASPRPPLRGAIESSGIRHGKLVAWVRSTGFREVRTYHIDSSIDQLLHLIPAARPAVLEYESSPAMRSSISRRRRLVASIGLHSLLYPGYMLLARA